MHKLRPSARLYEDQMPEDNPCTACGACCSYSSDWPRFSLETDVEIACIPEGLVATSGSGMRCVGDRCSALQGIVGAKTACSIYADRPHVCRACQPGDEECLMARRRHGLPALPVRP